MIQTDPSATRPPLVTADAPFWTVGTLVGATGGRWMGPALDPATPLEGMTHDSRAARAGLAFFAIRGETHDGHDFAADAAKAGASLVVASRPVSCSKPLLIVEETRRALGRLAAAYRDWLGAQGATFIAVCGSNGKTTTVRLIEAVLRSSLTGTASQKSFNNDVGVPTTILSARPGDQFVLCEVGTNHPGEINTLGAIVRPDLAVITSIGREHLEGFGDLAGVMREEASIVRHLRPRGTLYYGETEPLPDGRTFEGLLETFTNPFTPRCLEKAFWLRRLQPVTTQTPSGPAIGTQWKDLNGHAWQVPLAGEHNASNAMLAVWIAQAMGLDNDAIAAALLSAKGPDMRQQVTSAGPVTIINDAYNANPDSMLAALRTLGDLTPSAQRRVAVLGEMRELGPHTQAAHDEVLAAALAHPAIGAVMVAGPSFADSAARQPPGAVMAVEPEMNPEAARRLAAFIKPADAVLVKGSRSTAMERVAEAIAQRFDPSRPGLRTVKSAPSSTPAAEKTTP